ncbi:hypothetical protein SCHPADRAFT_878376 [Schizopora paradoxa]|uniref:S-adenosyl-L-methionine-dependent methyltransferase n=1 Tax=Schizopora paradoxa TaxID=27342 RepID=A0A0H2RL75_9AGAM|nr:hypothetical protein SCHPADRAFT_878376 [Schizopora paradoxa]
MRLYMLYGFLLDLQRSMGIALLPTLKAVFRDPSLVLKPLEVRRLYMAHVWAVYGDGIDESSRAQKEKVVCANARGVVLDMGAGYGHLVHYLEKERVTAYVALEPNKLMYETLRKTARAAGFVEEEGTFLLIGLPAEDIIGIKTALADWAKTAAQTNTAKVQVDTIVSILTLCSVPCPLRTLRALVRDVLAPGGSFLFYEHVRNPREDVRWWQDVVAPVWKHAFDGCVIGLDGVGGWASMETWGNEGEDEESLFWHQSGRCVKKAVVNGIHH